MTAFAGVFPATLMCFLAVGAVLPVLPRYVTGPLGGGDVAVGLVTGAFAVTAIVGRPIGGRLADQRGRRVIVLAGLAITALAGALYFLALGIPGLLFARLVLGLGDGWVFTAGLAWAVDLAPADRRGRAIAMYGLGVWGGLSIGPLVGELLYVAASYEAVWAFAAVAPLAGAAIAQAVPDRRGLTALASERQPLVPAAAVRPGLASSSPTSATRPSPASSSCISTSSASGAAARCSPRSPRRSSSRGWRWRGCPTASAHAPRRWRRASRRRRGAAGGRGQRAGRLSSRLRCRGGGGGGRRARGGADAEGPPHPVPFVTSSRSMTNTSVSFGGMEPSGVPCGP